MKLLQHLGALIAGLALIAAFTVGAALLADHTVAKPAPPMIPPLSAFSTAGNTDFAWAAVDNVSCPHVGAGQACWPFYVISRYGCPNGVYGEIGVGPAGQSLVDFATGKSGAALPLRPVLDELTTVRNDGNDVGGTPQFSCSP